MSHKNVTGGTVGSNQYQVVGASVARERPRVRQPEPGQVARLRDLAARHEPAPMPDGWADTALDAPDDYGSQAWAEVGNIGEYEGSPGSNRLTYLAVADYARNLPEERPYATALDVASATGLHPETARASLEDLEANGHVRRVYAAPGAGRSPEPEGGNWDGYVPAQDNRGPGESQAGAWARLPAISQPSGIERLVYLAADESRRRPLRDGGGETPPFAGAREVAALTEVELPRVRRALQNLATEGHVIKALIDGAPGHEDMYWLV